MLIAVFIVALGIILLAVLIVVPLVVFGRDLFRFRDESRKEARKCLDLEQDIKSADIHKSDTSD